MASGRATALIVRGAGVLCAIIAARRVGGWSGFLLRTLLGYGFGSFISAAGSAICSGCVAFRALSPLVQTTLAASIAAGSLYGGLIEIPVLINDVVAGQKLDELTGRRTR